VADTRIPGKPQPTLTTAQWYGSPVVDGNPDVTYGFQYGVSARSPGIYYEMLQTWPVLTSNFSDACDDSIAIQWETEKFEDETDAERAWNDTLENLLRQRLVVEMADRSEVGFNQFLQFIPHVLFYGFGAYQIGFDGDFESGKLTIWEIDRSAIKQFHYNTGDIRPTSISVQYSTGFQSEVDLFPNLIWIANNSPALGQMLGMSLGRPLINPYELWRRHIIGEGRYTLSAAGILDVQTPCDADGNPTDDDQANAKTRQMLDLACSGSLLGATWPRPNQKLNYFAPAAAPPFVAMRADCDRMAADLLGNNLATIASRQYATSGLAHEISEAQVKRTIARTNSRVNRFGMAIAQRMAQCTDYAGRIRKFRMVRAVEVDVLQKVRAYSELLRDGALIPQPGDQKVLRDLLGILPLVETQALPIRVDSARAVLDIERDYPSLPLDVVNALRANAGLPEKSAVPVVTVPLPTAPEVSIV